MSIQNNSKEGGEFPFTDVQEESKEVKAIAAVAHIRNVEPAATADAFIPTSASASTGTRPETSRRIREAPSGCDRVQSSGGERIRNQARLCFKGRARDLIEGTTTTDFENCRGNDDHLSSTGSAGSTVTDNRQCRNKTDNVAEIAGSAEGCESDFQRIAVSGIRECGGSGRGASVSASEGAGVRVRVKARTGEEESSDAKVHMPTLETETSSAAYHHHHLLQPPNNYLSVEMDTSSLVSLDTLSDTSCTTSCGGAPPSTISLPHDSPFDPSGQGYLFSTASGSHNGSIHANISTTTLVNPDPADLHTVHSSKSPSPELLSSASPVSSKKPSPVDGPSPFDNNNNNSNNNNNNNNSSNDNSNNHNSNNYNYINSAQGECDEGDGTLEAPDGGWKAWSVVLGSVLIQTFAFAPTEFIFGVFVQEYLESFPKASPSAVALIGTTGTCVTYLMGMVAGTLAGRWGYRATAFVGTLVMTVALILASFATQIWHLYLSQGILFGTGASLVYFSAIAAPTYWFKKKRGLALGIGASGAGLGGFYLAPLTQYLAGHVGIHWTLRVLAMYSLVVCGIASVLLFEREKPERRQKLLMKDLKNAHPKKIGSSFTMPAYSKDTVFVMLALFQLCLSLAYLTPVYFMELYSTHIGNSKQAGAAINAWFNAASFVSRIASGILADLVPPQWVLMGCIWVIVFAVLILWTFAKTFLLFLLFAVLYGAAFSGVSTVTPVIIADYYGHAQVARVLGIVYTASSPALLGGSFISGNLLEMTKTEVNFLPVIMSAGGMFALSAIFATAWVVLMAQRSIAPRPRDPAPTPTRRTSIEV